MSVQVLCTTKESRTTPSGSRYQVVTGIGGIGAEDDPKGRWYLPEATAITYIETGKYSFFTFVDGKKADVIVVKIGNKKELKTEGDSTTSNNLLRLEDCP